MLYRLLLCYGFLTRLHLSSCRRCCLSDDFILLLVNIVRDPYHILFIAQVAK